MDRLTKIAEELGKSYDIRIEYLPSMRVLSSYINGSDRNESDTDAWYKWIESNNFPAKVFGNHDHFDYHDVKTGQFVCLRRIDDDFINESSFMDITFDGGLYAILIAYFDQDMGKIAEYLKVFIEDKMDMYTLDREAIERSRIECMGEEMISPFENLGRYDIFMPIKGV